MRDYDNMPVLRWEGKGSAAKAKAQILHEEPIVLQMDDSFDMQLDVEEGACQRDRSSGRLHDCAPEPIISALAQINHLPALAEVGSVAAKAGLVVDLDPALHRIIVHD